MDSPSHQIVSKRVTRGATTLGKLKRKKGTDEKFELEWNPKGQAIGKNRSNFMSYIGVCARSLVDINIPRWDHVTQQIKESVWTAVTDVFEVPDDRQDWVMNIVCERWRSFKSQLRRFMYDKDGNICPNPPSLYSFIDQETWDKYLTTRQSDEFKEQSERHSEISKMNLYPYRGSRKGYVGIEEEIIQASKENNNFESPLEDASFSTPIVPRSLLWKKARTDKDGNMDESVRQVAAKMDSLSEQAAKGEITLSGRQDLLTTALGTKEHAGRVRGAGTGVTITEYFGRDTATSSSQVVERLAAMEEQVMALKRMVAELQSTNGLPSSTKDVQTTKGLPSTKDVQTTKRLPSTKVVQTTKDVQTTVPWDAVSSIARSYLDFPEGWSKCELASLEPGNPVVATGKVYNTHGMQPVTLENKPLEPGYMKVTIIDPKVQDAPLPVPTFDADTVCDAVGAFVSWPTDLIFRITVVGANDVGLSKQNVSTVATVSKTLAPLPESQPTPLKLITQSATELNDDDNNNSTKEFRLSYGKKGKGRKKQIVRTQAKASTTTPTNELRPSQTNRAAVHQQQKQSATAPPTEPRRPSQTDQVAVHQQQNQPATAPPTEPRSSQSNQAAVHQQQKLTTLTMKLMYRCARGMSCHDTITIGMPPTVWQREHNILITKDELLQWLFQENVHVSHVSIYIMYLHSLCLEWGISQTILFLRPQMLSPDTNHSEDEEVQYIADAMKGSNINQMYLAPYTDGKHWMLCAIHPLKDQAYWLDPAGNEARPDVKKVVQMAIRKFYSQRRRKKPRGKTQWSEIKCPSQANNDDCGYYVLRYMYEIMEKRQDSIPEQYYEDSPGPGAYEQHHIDEVRDKWVEFVQNHMDMD